MKVECIDKEFDITVGTVYEVLMVENQGDSYKIKNDSGIIAEYPTCIFKIVDAIKAKCISDANKGLIKGSIYDVVSIDMERNECRVIDESGEDYIYSINTFQFL